MPKVSVIMPTYNNAAYISEAIDSILEQTYKDYEIIVVDDGSVDDTKQVLEKYAGRINYIFHEKTNVATTRNIGILSARGDLIAFHDADDIWLPFKLQKQIEYLEKNQASIVYSKMAIIDEEKGFDGYKPRKSKEHRYLDNLNIPTPTVLMRKECFAVTGLFDAEADYMEDFELFYRLSQHYKIHYMDEVVGIYKKHSLSITSDDNMENKYRSKICVETKIYKNYKVPVKNRMGLLSAIQKDKYLLDKICLKKADYFRAFHLIKNSLLLSPFVGLHCEYDHKNVLLVSKNAFKPYAEMSIALWGALKEKGRKK